MQHQTVPQTREIHAHELAAGMTVIDGTDGALVVTSVSQDAIGSLLVSFEGVPEPTLYGRLVTVDILAEQVTRPGIAAAMTAARALLAAGWRYDSTSPMADYTTIRTLLHPSGREIHARTVDGGEQTALTMTGLTLDQVAGAINGAGLAPTEPTELPRADQPEPDLRHRLAVELHRIADDVVRLELPVGHYSSLRFGVVDSRADLERWADYFGTALDKSDSTGIPSVTARIKLHGDFSPELTIGVQSPKEQSEVEQLRARVAELESQTTGGTR